MYSEKVLQHFYDPKNWGKLENPDGVGEIGNPSCGDVLKIYIKIKDNIVSDIKFETLGCAAAIAVSSITTEMVKGMTIEESLKLSKQDIAKELGGLPPEKMHCSNLAEEALKLAIEDYKLKKSKE
jgi:nitrogen fixation protein NifU and related proteins